MYSDFSSAVKTSFRVMIALFFVLSLSTKTSSMASEQDGGGKKKVDQKKLSPDERKQVLAATKRFFESGAGDAAVDSLLMTKPGAVRGLLNEEYKKHMADQLKADFEAKQVKFESHVSPYTIKEVGKRPATGWPLVIAMHGGGGTAQRVNDSQWRHMQIYYKDQPQVEGYKYLALRAPNNTWNGFYDDYVYPLIENLIRQQVVLGDIDSNKVFLIGYSHGGYGAFAIGPKLAHRFAAVHASAAAPTDGQINAKTLRNTRFTFMVGGKDTAYGRAERCQKFAAKIDEIKKKNPNGYPIEFMFKPENGHGGLPDRDMLGQMYEHQRTPTVPHVTWAMTDSVVKNFYWLGVDKPKKGMEIDAKILTNNQIAIETVDCDEFSVYVDARLIDAKQPIELVIDGDKRTLDYDPKFSTLCKSLLETGDIHMSYDFEIKIKPEK